MVDGAYLRPALEIEGFYLAGNQQRATLTNPTTRLAEQTFDNTFPIRTTVLLANMVVGFRTQYENFTPYIGGGIGAANVSIKGATSTQIDPAEAGINHFNASPDSSAWTFAAQAKAGARFALGHSGAYLFGEYRYLYIGDVIRFLAPPRILRMLRPARGRPDSAILPTIWQPAASASASEFEQRLGPRDN